MNYKYPCTGQIKTKDFGAYLEENLKEPRRNIVQFGKELQLMFGMPYITLVNSGSSANLVAAMCMAEKIKGRGGRLTAAVSAFTFPTTISSLLMSGFKLEFVDVDEGGFNMNVEKLYELREVPMLVVSTHFLGFPCAIQAIRQYANENGSYVLQDGCESLNLQIAGKPAFEHGDICTWSFYHPHHLSSYGGGAVITLNEDDFVLCDSISHWGRLCTCHISPEKCIVPPGPAHQFTYARLGVNVEMSELNACFGRWQLQHFASDEIIRKQHYATLFNGLKGNKNLKLYPHPDISGSLFVFPVTLENGWNVNDAWKVLSEENLEIRTLMGGVSSEQPAFSHLSKQQYKNAHMMAEKTFFVGIHQTLSSFQIDRMVEIINRCIS